MRRGDGDGRKPYTDEHGNRVTTASNGMIVRATAKLVMHHANEEPILNSTTGKAKPKAAKLLFFDEGRKVELGSVTLQLGRGYLIAQDYLDEANDDPIEELIHNAIALTKLDFAREDLYLASLRAAARCFGKSLLDEEMRSDEEEEEEG